MATNFLLRLRHAKAIRNLPTTQHMLHSLVNLKNNNNTIGSLKRNSLLRDPRRAYFLYQVIMLFKDWAGEDEPATVDKFYALLNHNYKEESFTWHFVLIQNKKKHTLNTRKASFWLQPPANLLNLLWLYWVFSISDSCKEKCYSLKNRRSKYRQYSLQYLIQIILKLFS